MAQLDELIESATETLARFFVESDRNLIAYSGGKDSIVVAHMAAGFGITEAVCEVSWFFQRQVDSAKAIAEQIGLKVEYRDSLPLSWLHQHRKLIFTEDRDLIAWSFAARQQATIRRAVREGGYTGVIFGRRAQENTVSGSIQKTKLGLQCNPIMHWRTPDVWAYFGRFGLPVPWIYSTRFGKVNRNEPFYTAQAEDFGSIEGCWQEVEAMDARFSRQALGL